VLVAARSRLVQSPDGQPYEIVVEQAPRVGFFQAGPWRWRNTLTGSRSWWVTVSGDQWAWPLVRERCVSEWKAEDRATQLERLIAAGEISLERPAWRRRPRHS
jgi:hypothetical protein